MNTQDELNHLSMINTNISRINSNISNIYSTLNILSNSMLMNQRQTLINELREIPRYRTNLFNPVAPTFTTPSPLYTPPTSTSSVRYSSRYFPTNTTSTSPPPPPRPTPTSTSTPPTSTTSATSTASATSNYNNLRQSRESLNSIFSSLFRNELPSRYGIGNMEISVMGLNPRDEEEENIVISHHNIFNNTKIKLYTSEDKEEEEEGDVEDIPKCSICLENIENNQIIREITKCKHIFHVECADKWFENNIKCPNCRQDIRSEIV